jgi:diphthine-ammonia ligase
MKFVALVSGGKDSIFSIIEAQKQGHELLACVHLGRPVKSDEESYMYQTAASEAVQMIVEECIQVPLIHYVREGKSVQTSLVYQEGGSDGTLRDEVEDLYLALKVAVDRFPEVQAVASGALLSTYQRVRIENVCQRLGLTSFAYLWRRGSQHETLRAMIHEAGLEVVLVRVAAPPGLVPQRHLNKSLKQLEPTLYRLYDKYRLHVCGEGGEYESLCLFAPGLYRKRLVLDQVEVHLDESDEDIGVLYVKECHTEALDTKDFELGLPPKISTPTRENQQISILQATENRKAASTIDPWQPPPILWLPRVFRGEGGFMYTSAITSPKYYDLCSGDVSEKDMAVQEARDVFFILEALLHAHSCTAQDVGMVHLYLSDISHFQYINQYYQQCFGVLLPPSRSCVSLGKLPQNRRVMMDCWVLAGSGEYMRRQGVETNVPFVSPFAEAALVDTSIRYRQVLHVQSRSHWAPVCVGPYSQANTLFSAIHFLAGSIGLQPSSMHLRDTWNLQLQQSWKNLAQVLDALDQSSLSRHLLLGMVYVADHVYSCSPDDVITKISILSQEQMKSNAGVVAGLVDDIVTVEQDHDGYEDEETRIEVLGNLESDDGPTTCPLLVVSISAMPVGAQTR